MRIIEFIYWLAFLTVIGFNCSNKLPNVPVKTKQLSEKLIGSWGGEWQNNYSELHFLTDSTYIPIQDSVYFHIPYPYSFYEDTLQLLPFYLKYYASIEKDTLKLKTEEKVFKYVRISYEFDSLSDEFLYGFMIRRCNFLILKEIITVPEAYKQLHEYIEQESILDTANVIEEYIPLKK